MNMHTANITRKIVESNVPITAAVIFITLNHYEDVKSIVEIDEKDVDSHAHVCIVERDDSKTLYAYT